MQNSITKIWATGLTWIILSTCFGPHFVYFTPQNFYFVLPLLFFLHSMATTFCNNMWGPESVKVPMSVFGVLGGIQVFGPGGGVGSKVGIMLDNNLSI